MRRRALLNDALLQAIQPYDAIVYPTLSTVAYPVGIPFDKAYPDKYSGEIEMGSPGNLAGLPSINVPNGFGDHHLPTGLALMGRPWGEAQLTQIAKAFQDRTHFHLEHPKLVVV
jgi:aspartyl-tRNA(Asn)/glutamyl-tRNA(Gln) amidotransferase subunit A